MTPIELIGLIAALIYGTALFFLAVYGIHSLWLLLRFRRVEQRARAIEAAEELQELPPAEQLPAVLVQLPVFNERDVVARICDAVTRIRWPQDKLFIQLLDDSTDDAVDRGREAIDRLVAAGFRASHIHRSDRIGFKAGALAAGMDRCTAPYIAIFDADFIPPADFLERAIKPFLNDETGRLALVQGRWEHLNPTENKLCAAQAVGIDAHFAIEQGARAWSGLAMNFNGTCGLWRREAIVAAGGWEHETLTEDLDLSYRAQLAGWHCTYRLGLAVPGELPADIDAFRAQQFRWAKGSQQCTRKLAPRIWRSDWSLHKKIAAILHMSHYAVHPLMLISLLCAPIALWLTPTPPIAVLAAGTVAFLIGVFAPIISYIVSQASLREASAWSVLKRIPTLAAIGTGIAISNSRAVYEAWAGIVSPFVRTPKAGDSSGSYRAGKTSGVPELCCGLWALLGISLSIVAGRPWATPLLIIYASGFFVVGSLCLRSWLRRRAPGDPSCQPSRRRLAAIAACGSIALAAITALALHEQAWQQAPVWFAAFGLLAGAAYLGASALARQFSGRGLLVITVLGSLLMCLVAFGIAPSDDVNRYVVEGMQAAKGQNPYLVAPGSQEAIDFVGHRLDDGIIAGLNHPDWTAIYPPVAIVVQSFIALIHPSIDAMRVAALLAVAATLALLGLMLQRRGRPLGELVLVAWNPILPLWLVGEGHNDALMLPVLALALLLADRSCHRLSLISGSIAALIKPFAVWTLLPTLLQARSWRAWLLPPAIAALAYLPFIEAGRGLVGSLGRFGAEKHFHGAIDPFIRDGLYHLGCAETTIAQLTPLILLAILIVATVLIIYRHQRGLAIHGPGDGATLSAKLLCCFFLCLPTLHPWYLATLVITLPFLPLPALLLWTAMAPVYWLHGLGMDAGQSWAEVPWVTALAHAPCLLLLGWSITVRSQPWRLAPRRLRPELQTT